MRSHAVHARTPRKIQFNKPSGTISSYADSLTCMPPPPLPKLLTPLGHETGLRRFYHARIAGDHLLSSVRGHSASDHHRHRLISTAPLRLPMEASRSISHYRACMASSPATSTTTSTARKPPCHPVYPQCVPALNSMCRSQYHNSGKACCMPRIDMLRAQHSISQHSSCGFLSQQNCDPETSQTLVTNTPQLTRPSQFHSTHYAVKSSGLQPAPCAPSTSAIRHRDACHACMATSAS